MKRFSFLILISLLSLSCNNTWDNEAKELFHQACMESAGGSNMDVSAAKSMCDCRLEKAMKKYPNFADAMQHAGDLMDDQDLKDCK